MIQIVYERQLHKLTVKGHAGAGKADAYDMVCSGVSALVFTLAENVTALNAAGQVDEPTVYLEPGNSHISCRPYEGTKNIITLVFDTLCIGFEMLASNAPEFISYRMV